MKNTENMIDDILAMLQVSVTCAAEIDASNAKIEEELRQIKAHSHDLMMDLFRITESKAG
jgi:hypothetical protein